MGRFRILSIFTFNCEQCHGPFRGRKYLLQTTTKEEWVCKYCYEKLGPRPPDYVNDPEFRSKKW